MNIQHSLKSGDTKDHFRRVKVPGTTPYWKVWIHRIGGVMLSVHTSPGVR